MSHNLKIVNVIGFEKLPIGTLLQKYIDSSSAQPVAYERCIEYKKEYHHHDWIDLSFPRGATKIDFSFKNFQPISVDVNSFIWIPPFIEHNLISKTVLYDNFAVFIKPEQIEGLYITVPTKFSMTILLKELVNDYFYNRVVLQKSAQQTHNEMNLIINALKKILTKTSTEIPGWQKIQDNNRIVRRALEFIEANLFNHFTSQDLVRHCHTSRATLFREFNKSVSLSPFDYVLHRKMDEAANLIKTGRYHLNEIATIVGYQEVAAFSKAFKKHFGLAPSQFN